MTTKRSSAARSRNSRQAADALDQIVAALGDRLPKAQQALGEAFTRVFYSRMTADEFPQHSAEAWASLAAGFLDLVRTRKPGTPLVRLFNPSLRANGWESAHTVLQVANDDMPFLVDSVTLALAERGIAVHVLGHPVVKVARDRAGKLTGVGEGVSESFMHLEIDRLSPEEMADIEAAIRHVLDDVRAIVVDWPSMQGKMLEVAEDLGNRRSPADADAVDETQHFLRWAADNHFTFLGYREYEVARQGKDDVLCAVPGTGLGLLRGEERGKPRALTSLGTHNIGQSAMLDTLILTKTNARATVHRRGYMDYIGVLSFDKSGKPVREERFLGLFTSSAYNRRPWDIPVVRRRYENVMRKSGLPADGHSGKALKHILESLPRDELFQAGEDELFRTSMGVLGLQERVRSRIFLRRDKYGRFYSALVYIPRDRFNTEVRLRIEAMLKDALNADHVDSSVQLGESPLAQLHIMVRPKPADGHSGTVPDVDVAAIEAQLARIVRNWADDLRDALIARHGEEAALPLASAYGRALPAGYIENVSAEVAANDVENLAALAGPDDLRLSLYRSQQAEGGLRFKFYRQGDDIALSDALPMMENMGLRVISEHPYRIEAAGRVLFIQDFEVEYPRPLEVSEIDVDFEEAFAAIWRGQAENDGFNRLILAAGLSWRQVAMLRAYCKYLLQVGVTFSQAYMEQTLSRYPLLARLLVELFEARFDPTTGKESKAEIRAGMQKFQAQLERLAAGDAALAAAVAPVI
ncbi:MAG TPA: NAD-glutamate dehydrogenase, partial [Lysobacter sp.]